MPPKGSDLIFDHRHNAANRVLLDCRGAGILVRRAHRMGPVTPTVKLGAGHGAGVSRDAGRDALMPLRLEDGFRDGRAAGRVPRDRGRSGGRTPARAHSASGLRLASGPRNVGAAARRVRTLPAVTLSDTGGQGERTRSRRYAWSAAVRARERARPRSGHYVSLVNCGLAGGVGSAGDEGDEEVLAGEGGGFGCGRAVEGASAERGVQARGVGARRRARQRPRGRFAHGDRGSRRVLMASRALPL